MASSEEKQPFDVNQYVIDLNAAVKRQGLKPLPSRNGEFGQVLEVLSCRAKRNVLIIGEAGVGKTSVVLELARRMNSGELGAVWAKRRLLQLNVAALVAGARFRGQYEERLLELVNALKKMPEALLYIDDIHTFFNASGNRSGNLDASHVFKPALAQGELQMVGTTSDEYHRLNLAGDVAIMRAFQVIRLREPERVDMLDILEWGRHDLEEFHGVSIDRGALESAYELSQVFVRDRALPDKSVGLLDLACVIANQRPGKRGVLSRHIDPAVTKEDVIQAASRRSGIPADKIATRDHSRFLEIEDFLRSRVVGQNDAISSVARVLRVSRMNLQLKPEQPDGVFLFAGPTGVGKTELALAMTEFLFGDRSKMIRIDMSEFMEHISTSKLIGIAPGYVGYHDKTQLTDRVRQDPYCLVLLDEIEKASPQVLNLFLQVFDTGRLTDSKGGTVYFDHTVFVLTSNLGTDLYGRSVMGYGTAGSQDVSPREMMRALKSHLSPEFINRLDEKVYFHSLRHEDMERILELNLLTIQERLERDHRVTLQFTDIARRTLIERGFNAEFGARELHRTIRGLLLDPLSRFLMETADTPGRRTILVKGKDLTPVVALDEEVEVPREPEVELLSFNVVE